MYNQRILTEVLSHQPFDLRIPFLLILFTLTEFISASKSNTILCLIFSRLTYYKLRFWAGIGHLWVMYLAHGREKNCPLRELEWQWIQKTNCRHFITSFLRDTSKLTGDWSPLLPQQKASHQGLDLISAQQGERPSRQQSCPLASHHPAINAPRRLAQERPSLALHPGRLKMRGTGCEGRDGQEEESWMKPWLFSLNC